MSGVLQAALSLYLHLGSCTLLQLEAFLWKLLLPLAEGKGAHSVGRQEAALEVSSRACLEWEGTHAPPCRGHSPPLLGYP